MSRLRITVAVDDVERELDISDETMGALAVLGCAFIPPIDAEPLADRVVRSLELLMAHAGSGVHRPGSWERGWLTQVFSYAWQGELERDPHCSWRMRPRDPELLATHELLEPGEPVYLDAAALDAAALELEQPKGRRQRRGRR